MVEKVCLGQINCVDTMLSNYKECRQTDICLLAVFRSKKSDGGHSLFVNSDILKDVS